MKQRGNPAAITASTPLPGAAKFKAAAIIMWIVALVQIVAGIALVVQAPEQVDDGLAAMLGERRISLYEVKAVDAEQRLKFDYERDAAILRVRWWQSGNIFCGVLGAVCALFVWRRPLWAPLTALVAFFFTSAAMIAFGPPAAMALLMGRLLLLYGLTYALFSALVGQKERRAVRE